MSAPKKVIDLVNRFHRNLDTYRSGSYNETMLRKEFIDPFFKALGWDVDNEQGIAEAYKDVVHEEAIKIGGATKAPDYGFRIGATRKFFLEAKKPSVNIAEDIHPAYQLRRYAWSAKLPLSILTDFEEFAVYDCRIKPIITDKASTARIMYLTYGEYEERWDEIAEIFSRDALARNIALRNPELSHHEMNFAVQRTIDRIIFLRICEDRGIEDYGQLMALQNGTNIYQRLVSIYRRADEKYNSGLFHFRVEKGRPEKPDELTLNLNIDDKVLKDIFKELYYPESPYEFSVLPADILGHIYEQFLGKVIRLTLKHRAVVEEKPEVRKAGGVYYTPTYIVDYIVKNTVGKLLEKKTPKQAANLKILDPACGSGSFLIGAYQYLLDWHRDWYIENGSGKWAKGRSPKLYQASGGGLSSPELRRAGWRLTTAERKRILLNNIYGVDIDPQAVEVTKLSLLLKVLENESEETINRQRKLFHERALPDLGNNIKCGNSLIGPDFYDNQQISLLDEEERYRINAFDWEAEFPEVFSDRKKDLQGSQNLEGHRKGGPGRRTDSVDGFDVVIGNPPYVRQEMLGNAKSYFRTKYRVYHGTADLYTYFIERGVSLLKIGGYFSYIVSNKWLRANYGQPIRRWMKQKCIEGIVDFGDLQVFKGQTTYPCILTIRKDKPRKQFKVTEMKTLEFSNLKEYVDQNSYLVSRFELNDAGWALVNESTKKLIKKIVSTGIPLEKYVDGEIYRGVLTGLNKAFVIDRKARKQLIEENSNSAELIKPFLIGKDIQRYHTSTVIKYLIFMPNGWTREKFGNVKDAWKWLETKYPAISNHLESYSEAGKMRWDKGEFWWELRSCDYYDEFEKEKICWGNLCSKTSFTIDSNSTYVNAPSCILNSNDRYVLGCINSSLLWWFLKGIAAGRAGGFIEAKPIYVKELPIHPIDLSNPHDKSRYDKMVKLVDRMLDLHKQLAKTKTPHDSEVLQRQITSTDRQIDRLVYELYELREEEIGIVERDV